MLLIVLATAFALYVAGLTIDYVFGRFDDAREPPRVKPVIPVIGHIIWFLRYGYDYYSLASNRIDSEVYTVGVGTYKVYVTKGTRSAQWAQRAKALSFAPLFQMGNKVNAGVSDESNRLYSDQVVDDIIHCSKNTLNPGLHLDSQNMRMGQVALGKVKSLAEKSQEIELYAWVQHVILHATATGLYGDKHPFVNPAVERDLWIWDDHRPGHVFGIDIMNKGYSARERVFDAFDEYFQDMPSDAAPLIKERQHILCESGIPKREVSQIQATLSDAAYPNTVPTTFWTVFEIFSRPDLLEEVRNEIIANAVHKTDKGNILDVAALKTKCPVLLSAYQETQRTRHSQVAFRMVREDTILDGKYLLKQGNLLHMPAKATHMDTNLWGDNASVYDPYRFLPKNGEARTKISASNFMPWGSSPHMCPARQFASTEIMIITALLCMTVDMHPKDRKAWPVQPAVRAVEVPTLPRPKSDIKVKVIPRSEALREWSLLMGESKTRVPLMSG